MLRNETIFTKHGEQARNVLEALSDKYADEESENIDTMEFLKMAPLINFGSTIEIINGIFGSCEKHMEAIKDLENELYKIYYLGTGVTQRTNERALKVTRVVNVPEKE